MAGKIFINYRRGDDPGFTQALYQRLEAEFGNLNLFMDVEGHIRPGDDFVRVLDAQVAACDVLLAVIGPRWTELMIARAGDPDDFVAIEIRSALDRGKRVIPVLVGGASMPKAELLPEAIRALTRRNAVGLRSERFKADCQGLVGALKAQLADVQREEARTAAEREAAEAARRKAEDEAASRAKEAEARARAQAVQGLSAEQIAKAEELANWEYIKDSSDAQEFRNHLARFPKGIVERNARAKLEAVLWQTIYAAGPDDPDRGGRLSSFIDEFPDGKFRAEARAMQEADAARARAALEQLALVAAERDAWADASAKDTKEAYKAFLSQWPKGEHASAAKARFKARGGGRTRRWLLWIVRAVLGTVALLVGVIEVTMLFSLGFPAWRMLYDQSTRTFTGHSSWVTSVAISPDGETAISGSEDKTLKLWDVASGRELQTFIGHKDWVTSVAFSPDGKTALSGSRDKTLKLWDIASGQELRTFNGHTDIVTSVTMFANGQMALSGSGDNTLKLWDVASAHELRTFIGHRSEIWAVAVSPDGKAALSGSKDKTIKLWDIASGKELRTFSGHTSTVTSLVFLPDGKRMLSCSNDKTLKLWDVASGQELRTFTGHSEFVVSLAISLDGKTALSGSADDTIKLWDIAAGKEVRNFTGHSDTVLSLAFSPDGKTALSGSWDRTIKLWDLTRQ